MNSMTGYGKGAYSHDKYDILIELKSVNHRFLDLSIKTPKGFAYAEDVIRKTIQRSVARGHVDVYFTYLDKRVSGGRLAVNEDLASQYVDASKRLARLGIVDDMTTSTLLRMPEVSSVENDLEAEDLTDIIVSTLNEAITSLNAMRYREGEAIREDFVKKLEDIESLVALVAERAPLVIEEYTRRLRERINELLGDLPLDESRLITEVGLYSDKVCIDEELTRLAVHIAHFREIILDTQPVGRKLDFLVQEINRECNTIGSKCNDAYIADKVVALKNEVEKLREQVQNIE